MGRGEVMNEIDATIGKYVGSIEDEEGKEIGEKIEREKVWLTLQVKG